MKYVIWGCGKRGKTLALMLGRDRVSAFIDSNKDLKGSSFTNIPIIDYEEYLRRCRQEIVIIAVKGHEKSIEKKLDQNNIPHITVETSACIYILNQLRQSIDKIVQYDNVDGMNVIYGWNIYGAYLYELLKARNRRCCIVLQNALSEKLSELLKQEFPVENEKILQDNTIERVFLSAPAELKGDSEKSFLKVTNTYEIYKEFDVFYNPEIARFRNIHKGKRCFIIATGPSLRIEDLNTLKLNGEICISVNAIFKAFNKTEWRPDYYCLTDLYGLLQWRSDVLQMDVKEKFISDTGWWFDDTEVADNIHKFHLFEEYSKDDLPQFTDDFSRCAYCSSSVVYDGALQLAVYMGFQKIYMLGADCTVEATRKKQHFVEDYEDDRFSKAFELDTEQLFKGYRAARQFAERHGIQLMNATRGGALEELERVDFDSLF